MNKRTIISILIPAFLLQVVGCYSTIEITKKEIPSSEGKIQEVLLNNSDYIKFNSDGGKYFADKKERLNPIKGKIIGKTENEDSININLEEVNTAKVEVFDNSATTWLIIGTSLVAAIVILELITEKKSSPNMDLSDIHL